LSVRLLVQDAGATVRKEQHYALIVRRHEPTGQRYGDAER
jgi:hypothetical protein